MNGDRIAAMAQCRAGRLFASGLLALLASCAAPPPPAPPPPPAAIPSRPVPPGGASLTTPIPPKDAYGLRQTVNAGISKAQTTWNMRSAYNVAALNCSGSQYASILDGYKRFIRTHEKGLLATYKAVDAEWRGRFGSSFVRERESYSTRVYNYFALPPVLPGFCNEMVGVAAESGSVPSSDLDGFSARSLGRVEGVFEKFYQDFEQYQKNAAAWDATYGSGRSPQALGPAAASDNAGASLR